MSALLLCYDFPPLGGGIARALGEIARHASPGRLVVSTGSTPGSEAFDASCRARVDRVGVPSRRLRTWTGLLRWGWRGLALADSLRPDFLWAGNLKPAGHVARWLGRRRQVPFGLMVYGLDLQLMAHQAATDANRRRRGAAILAEAAGTVAISRWTAGRFAALARALGAEAAADRVRVVMPGVDTKRFRPGEGDAALRVRYGLDGRPWLLTVARLERHKGIDRGLELLARLRAVGLDVGYAVAGEGPALPDLKRQAGELGLSPHVRWLGFVPEHDLPAIYRLATIYLGLSREEGAEVEGFGLALLEAQASALPVVAGAGGGTRDAVSDGATGYVVSAADALPAVRRLLGDPAHARALGEAGRARAEREFRWERVVGELEDAATAFRAEWLARVGR